MKTSKKKIFILFLAGIFCACLLYSAIYIYLRNDNWMEHCAKSKFVSYSRGYVYDGHSVELMQQYQDNYNFASIEGFTIPGRLIEKTYWELKFPKASTYPEEWKLPNPDKDWNKVLKIGRSRSETAYSELQRISKSNKDLPSGKLATTMVELWDPLLKTFISSSPRKVTDIPWYAINGVGIYHVKIQVKKDGTVTKASMYRNDDQQKEAEEIIKHTLYCPAKDGQDYLEAEYTTGMFVCGF
jgi:hypothetical protein